MTAAALLNVPARIQNHWLNRHILARSLSDDVVDSACAGFRLLQRVSVRSVPVCHHRLTVVDDLSIAPCRLAPGLRFDGEHAGWANEHVVDVKPLLLNIMKSVVAMFSQAVQELANRSLAFKPKLQTVDVLRQSPNPPERNRHTDDRQAGE